jgi:hypothetical protein
VHTIYVYICVRVCIYIVIVSGLRQRVCVVCTARHCSSCLNTLNTHEHSRIERGTCGLRTRRNDRNPPRNPVKCYLNIFSAESRDGFSRGLAAVFECHSRRSQGQGSSSSSSSTLPVRERERERERKNSNEIIQ